MEFLHESRLDYFVDHAFQPHTLLNDVIFILRNTDSNKWIKDLLNGRGSSNDDKLWVYYPIRTVKLYRDNTW